MTLFIDGRYKLRAEADVIVPKPDPVWVKAISDQFVILGVEAEPPGEIPMRIADFERDYFLLPSFLPGKNSVYGYFRKDGVREPMAFGYVGDERITCDWWIDLSRVPADAYFMGWQP